MDICILSLYVHQRKKETVTKWLILLYNFIVFVKAILQKTLLNFNIVIHKQIFIHLQVCMLKFYVFYK